MYELELTNRFGETHCIQLFGIDKIGTNPGPCNLDGAYEFFPHVDREAIDIPTGPVDIFIGQDLVRLLPTGGNDDDPRDLIHP